MSYQETYQWMCAVITRHIEHDVKREHSWTGYL
jgi:hypothetical protein